MRRRYRVLTFNKASGQYLSLGVEWQDTHGAWHTKVVRSYGSSTPTTISQVQGDLAELQRLASNPSDPIPLDTINDTVWAGFAQSIQNPLAALPFTPLLIARDLAHLASYVIAHTSGDVTQMATVTQPKMPAAEQVRFVQWLSGHSSNDQASILAYQWKFDP